MAENEDLTAEDLDGNDPNEVVEEQVSKWSISPEEENDYVVPTNDIVEEVVSEEKPIAPIEEVVEDVVEEEVVEEQPIVPLDIDENVVLKFLNEKGISATTLDELKPKEVEQLDAETEAYLKYKKETNRGYKDFLETQRDYSQEPKEAVLMQNLRLENPTLNDKQIERLYEREYAFDSEFDSEETILDKEINIERDYQKALAVLNSQKEQYMVRRSSDESVPEEYKNAKQLVDNWQQQQEENKIAQQKSRDEFLAKTDEVFTNNFEGFKVNIGGTEFKVLPEDIQKTKETLSDLSNFDKKFFDETTGNLKDPQGYYKALHFGMNADKMAEHFLNLGKALKAEEDERVSKNIPQPGQRNVEIPMRPEGERWTIEK